MPDAPEWSRIGLAAALSVLTHLVAAGALAGLFGGLTGERAPETAGPPPPDRIPLGIERSSATTITWIGFEEPAPQQARRSTVEQAAQRLGGAPPSPPALNVRQAAREATARAQQAAAEAWRAVERVLGAFELPAPAESTSVETAPAERAEASPPRAPAEPARPAETPGNAEREADAVSIEEPVDIEWGRPIAAEGLEILTRKKGPNYSAYTRVATRPTNPFVEISFGAGGLVRHVDLITSSGVRDVDRPLLDAIYTWRARGARIDALAPGEDVKVRLRIVIR